MAKSKDGFFGKLSGKIGDVVVSSWKGIPYVKRKTVRNTSNTRAQQNQRSKFGLIISFVNKVKPVINAGFKWNIDHMTELNSATSYNMKRAVKGEYPELEIDYPSVLVARGDLAAPSDARATDSGPNQITFSWTYNPEANADAEDKGLILAYCPDLEQAVYEVEEGPERKDEHFILHIPARFSGYTMETYMAFISPDGEEASDSVYLGQVTVG